MTRNLVTRGAIEESDDGSHSASSKELSMDSEAGDEIAIHIQTTTEEAPFNEYQTAQENPAHQAMYKAASEGDWREAQRFLSSDDKSLGWIKITAQGDRALHLAVLGGHTEFVGKLIDLAGWEMLELYDDNGYTACCYAAMAGNLELVRIMAKANPFVVNTKNLYGTTPLALAISYGHKEVVSYFLSVDENIKGLTGEELFKILLLAIVSKMFDVALMIFEKREGMARMKDGDGRTALHVFAKLDMSSGDDVKGQADHRLKLAKKLWHDTQYSGTYVEVLELIKNDLILHDAAKVGNLDIIKMITYDFPDLLLHTDKDKYSIFHIAVIHRQWNMLELVRNARNVKNFDSVSIDKDGNNLLHSAAKSLYHGEVDSVAGVDIEMERAFTWFKAVEAVVPPIYGKMENSNKDIPIALFWKEHAPLLGKIETYTKKAAESGMLISTIVLTLVFAVAFAPPGGFNQDTGIPVLLKNKWFKAFIVFKILALFSSTLSIIGFWSIITSKTGVYQFLDLLRYLRLSMSALLLSVLFVISAFLSAFFLVFVQEKKALAMSLILPLYMSFVVVIFYQILKVFSGKTIIPG